MSKRVYDYLNNKDYNILAEKLIYMIDNDFSKENFERGEINEIFGNWASAMVYPFSNEYLDDMFKDLNLENKRVLVVGSSGDQALHAVDKGASDVTIIDGNMWAKPFVELKISAIKNLSFEDFSEYIGKGKVFNSKYYAKVSHCLSKQSKAFWDEILLDCPQSLMMKAYEVFLHNAIDGQDLEYGKKFHSYYNNENDFNSLKEKLKKANIEVKYAELNDFPKVADGKYSLIMLSNIFDYVHQNDFFSVVKTLNDKHLSNKGIMQVYSNIGARGRTQFTNKNRFDEGLLRFFSRCSEEDIRIDYQKLRMPGNRIINWIKGNAGQGNFMMKKSNLNGVNPIFEEIIDKER